MKYLIILLLVTTLFLFGCTETKKTYLFETINSTDMNSIDENFLKLDQTIPQNIINGRPVFNNGLTVNNDIDNVLSLNSSFNSGDGGSAGLDLTNASSNSLRFGIHNGTGDPFAFFWNITEALGKIKFFSQIGNGSLLYAGKGIFLGSNDASVYNSTLNPNENLYVEGPSLLNGTLLINEIAPYDNSITFETFGKGGFWNNNNYGGINTSYLSDPNYGGYFTNGYNTYTVQLANQSYAIQTIGQSVYSDNGRTSINGVYQPTLNYFLGSAASNVNRIAHFDNDQSDSRTEVSFSNSGSGAWQNNFVSFMVHGENFGPEYYIPGAAGKTSDGGWAYLLAQGDGGGTIQKGLGIFTYFDIPVIIGQNNTPRITLAPGTGNVLIKQNTDNGTDALQVSGNISSTGTIHPGTTSTGGNSGSSLCIGANNEICICGSCS